MKQLEEKNRCSAFQDISDSIAKELTELIKDLPRVKKKSTRVYPNRAARETPRKIQNPGTNSPYEPCEEIGDTELDSPGVKVHISDTLPESTPVYAISGDDSLITINSKAPEFLKDQDALKRDVFQFYVAFRHGPDGEAFCGEIPERRDAYLGYIRKRARSRPY